LVQGFDRVMKRGIGDRATDGPAAAPVTAGLPEDAFRRSSRFRAASARLRFVLLRLLRILLQDVAQINHQPVAGMNESDARQHQ
jgi:hypothetical protein